MKKIKFLRILIAVLLSVGLVMMFSGCAKKPAETVAVQEEPLVIEPCIPKVEPVAEEPLDTGESVLAETVVVEEVAPAMDYHLVKKGECLWWIAEYEDIYNDPFMWPLIYYANKDQITNPDLIYPGQELQIPRAGYGMEEIQDARKSAGAPRPYTPPEDAMAPIQ